MRIKAKDPAQETVRAAKEVWNKEVSNFIIYMIDYKKIFNGHAGTVLKVREKTKIHQPQVEYLTEASANLIAFFEKIKTDLFGVIKSQDDYVALRQKERATVTQEKTASPYKEVISSKQEWNSKSKVFLKGLIELKRLVNGHPNTFYKEKSSITNIIPSNPSSIIEALDKDLKVLLSSSLEILNHQKGINVKKSVQNQVEELKVLASNPLSRFFHSLKNIPTMLFGDKLKSRYAAYKTSLINQIGQLKILLRILEADIVVPAHDQKSFDNMKSINKLIGVISTLTKLFSSVVDKIEEDYKNNEAFNLPANALKPEDLGGASPASAPKSNPTPSADSKTAPAATPAPKSPAPESEVKTAPEAKTESEPVKPKTKVEEKTTETKVEDKAAEPKVSNDLNTLIQNLKNDAQIGLMVDEDHLNLKSKDKFEDILAATDEELAVSYKDVYKKQYNIIVRAAIRVLKNFGIDIKNFVEFANNNTFFAKVKEYFDANGDPNEFFVKNAPKDSQPKVENVSDVKYKSKSEEPQGEIGEVFLAKELMRDIPFAELLLKATKFSEKDKKYFFPLLHLLLKTSEEDVIKNYGKHKSDYNKLAEAYWTFLASNKRLPFEFKDFEIFKGKNTFFKEANFILSQGIEKKSYIPNPIADVINKTKQYLNFFNPVAVQRAHAHEDIKVVRKMVDKFIDTIQALEYGSSDQKEVLKEFLEIQSKIKDINNFLALIKQGK